MDVKKVITALKIDPKAITDLENEVQKNRYILSQETAKELFVKFWSLKATVSEWVTKAKKYELEAKIKTERILVALKSSSEEKSEAAKERVAKDTAQYQDTYELYETAKLVREHLAMKRTDLLEAHYMCKELIQDYRAEKLGTPKDNGSF